MTLLALCLAGGLAGAVKPPPQYRSELFQSLASAVEDLNASDRFEEGLALAERIEKHVEPSAPVRYELAYSLNRLGRLDEALQAYDDTLALKPDLAVARYDRGEILLRLNEDLRAKEDFEKALAVRPDHWAIHFRLAQVAGRQGDAAHFEHHLTESVRHGVDFRLLLADDDWMEWISDPVLGPILARMVVVYGDEAILDQMRSRGGRAPSGDNTE